MKILLFKLWAIGDVIMTTPFLRQLKSSLSKQSKISYMVWSKSSSILSWNSDLDEIIEFDENIFSGKKLVSLIKLIFTLRKLSKQYDKIVLLDKHGIFWLVALLAGFKSRIWFDRLWKEGKYLTDKIYYDASRREVEYYLELLPLFWIEPNYSSQQYNILDWVFLNRWTVDSKLDIFIKNKSQIDDLILNLKKSWKKLLWVSTWWWNQITNQIHKNKDCRWWNINNWTKLVDNLTQDNIVLSLWSNSDRKLFITNNNFINLLWNYSLLETIYIISKLDLLICQESWFSHFWWCTNTPIIPLAWPTNPSRFFPLNHSWEYIWKCDIECYDCFWSFDKCTWDEIDRISVEDVLEVIQKYL